MVWSAKKPGRKILAIWRTKSPHLALSRMRVKWPQVLVIYLSLGIWGFSMGALAQAELRTNGLTVQGAPSWLKRTRVERLEERMQSRLEWTLRRTPVVWYQDQAGFEAAHSLGPLASAVTMSTASSQRILLGPKITNENFDEIFSHELVHVIVAQKYRGAIPKWLEEGLANHLSRRRKVDYQWLAKQKIPSDVSAVAHPLKQNQFEAQLAYTISQALIEMLASRCDLENLIRLSVQKKMTDYIKTYCEIDDLNLAFQKWLKKKSPTSPQGTGKSLGGDRAGEPS